MNSPWTHDGRGVLSNFKSKGLKHGLTTEQVEENRSRFGKNEIPPPEGTSLFVLILKQFEDLLVLILLGAAVVSFLLALFEEGEDRATAFIEPAVILVILIANATVGVVQETNAENAIEKLKESEASEALVIRDGAAPRLVHSSELVPGDSIVIADGNKVPADARLLEITSAALEVDEAALTGESEAVSKITTPIRLAHALNQDKRNMLFSGTLVVRGKCIAVVTSTGALTELGKIATDLSGKKSKKSAQSSEEGASSASGASQADGKSDDDDDDDPKTPLQKKLDQFGEQLSKVIGCICVVVWLINIGHFTDPVHGSVIRGAIYYFKVAVALAVAAIPEGLPAVVTTCLALGTLKMAKNGAIVRSLPSVETLGCTTVICSDKTGTLTTNKMSVQKVLVAGAKKDGGRGIGLIVYDVHGDDWNPTGSISIEEDKDEELVYPGVDVPALAEISCISSLCTEATLVYDADSPSKFGKTGAPTEAALLVLAEKIGVPEQNLMDSLANVGQSQRCTFAYDYWNSKYERVHTLEFSRTRKSMSVVVRDKKKKSQALVCKGAAERILERSTNIFIDGTVRPLTAAVRSNIGEKLDELASQGLRCVAFAFKEAPAEGTDYADINKYEKIESELTFIGIAGMLDPPRPPVRDALAQCNQAGIRVIVITGDNQRTAEAICRRIGLFDEKEDLAAKSFTGEQLNEMKAHQLEKVVETASLFSRVEPRHKLSIVEALKKKGHVVAMTGDGVNDATALKRADIGIAMGSGTSVAKEASKMVLQDDNFATIVMAVQEGRAIYANTKQFIRYLISSNIGEVACIFGSAALGIPDALIPVQLLWVNLVTDGLPATALGFNPPDPDIMKSRPRSADENIINGWMFFRYMAIGLYVGLGTVGGFIWWYLYASSGPKLTYWQLTHFGSCASNPVAFKGVECAVFSNPIPSTISLSILVVIEMFNAFNALSENQSLLKVTPLSNLWVAAAASLSFILHIGIVYIPFFASIFHVAPLKEEEWIAVLTAAFPVFLLDEGLKFISRLSAKRAEVSQKKAK